MRSLALAIVSALLASDVAAAGERNVLSGAAGKAIKGPHSAVSRGQSANSARPNIPASAEASEQPPGGGSAPESAAASKNSPAAAAGAPVAHRR
jgi:hypothetical protein